MQTMLCLLPVVPVRKEPSHRSEMVSQLLFGEYVEAGEERNEFSFVTGADDGYQGWVQTKQLTVVAERLTTTVYTAGFATPVAHNNALLHVPYGSAVFGEGLSFTVAGEAYTYLVQPQQTWNMAGVQLSETVLPALYQPYLNTPYLWGGKSVFGTDCSGFVQQVFKLLGVRLRRDAYQQAEEGSAVESVQIARAGDLAFFHNEAGRVTHVGLVLSGSRIVHASGKVRIDDLRPDGIYAAGKQTHTLHSIRRMM